MAFIEIDNLSFAYPGEKKKALCDINLSVEQGEFIVLCGPSGSGKTTLLRHLKKEITPKGVGKGSIFYEGIALSDLKSEKSAKEIGMVFQDPENQMVMDTVIHELAFSLENFGVDPIIIKKRTAEMTAFFGLEDSLYKSIHELSGGQKQIVNLCSVMMLQPKVLLLDEPTSQLDPVAARELFKMVYELNREFSITVIVSEHRLEDIFPVADRVVYMEDGYIKYNDTPKGFSCSVMEKQDGMVMAFLPTVTRLFYSLRGLAGSDCCNDIPLTMKEGKMFMEKIAANRIYVKNNMAADGNIGKIVNSVNSVDKVNRDKKGWDKENGNNKDNKRYSGNNCNNDNKDAILECRDVFFRYGRESSFVLKKLSLSISRSDYLAVLGGNGSGKTTLLQVLGGLIVPQRGSVLLENRRLNRVERNEKTKRIGYVSQNPLLHFTFDTVKEELEYMAGRVGDGSRDSMERMIGLFDLEDILYRHPYDCSGGQQQKLAIACALIPGPEILLVDEPTKGMDAASKVDFARLLGELHKSGLTIVMVTHDIEFAAAHVSKCAMMFDGSIAFCASPKEFFGSNFFYTTVINRVMRDYIPDAVTYKDVINLCGVPERF